MNKQSKLTRRNFIALSVVGVGGMCLFSQCSGSPQSRWRYLTEQESTLLDALVEQIIPTDQWPGGKDAGVTNYIDTQLTGFYTKYQEIYRKGLMAIQETCKVKFKKRFEQLPWDEQTRFLEAMERGKMEGENWKDGLDREFFGLIKDHSLQGYY